MNNQIILDLVSATENTALCAHKWLGLDNKFDLDVETADVMRKHLNNIPFSAMISFGEGAKDNVPHLSRGEKVGLWKDMPNTNPLFDICLDPVDGSGCCSRFMNGATTVLAISEKDSFVSSDYFYMNKLACRKDLAEKANINIKNSPDEIVYKIADAKKVNPTEITVCILDRNRNIPILTSLRSTNCKIMKIMDCDINPCIQAGTGVIDIFISSGGTGEGLLSCAALKALGGFFQFQFIDNQSFMPVDDNIYDTDTGIKNDVVFISTGVTDNSLTNGVRVCNGKMWTQTIVMNSYNNKVMKIETEHRSS